MAIVGLIDMIVFMIWRHDKPLNDPGGPVGSMGTGIVLWSISGNMLMTLSTLVLAIGRYRNLPAASGK